MASLPVYGVPGRPSASSVDAVSLFQSIVDLVTGLAWPVAVVWIVLAFRAEIRDVLHSRSATVKAGPFELGFEQAAVEVEAANALRPTTAGDEQASPLGLDESMQALAVVAASSPVEAVLGSFALVEQALRDRLSSAGIDPDGGRSAVQLAAQAASRRLITSETVNSIQGVAVLRNLAAHGHGGEIDTQKALDYLVLVEATLYAIRQPGAQTG